MGFLQTVGFITLNFHLQKSRVSAITTFQPTEKVSLSSHYGRFSCGYLRGLHSFPFDIHCTLLDATDKLVFVVQF